MKTPDLSHYHDPIDSPPAARPLASRSTSWFKQTQTILLFLCWALGIAGAFGHHFYYEYLHGKTADNQQWIVRSGTAISFTIKLLFSVSVGAAYSQIVWQSLRGKPFSLGTIDGLFTLKNDPLQFLKLEILGGASLCTIVAAISWGLVLVPILVPASISVVPSTRITIDPSFPTYTLNFSKSFLDLQYRNGTPIVPLQLSKLVTFGANTDGYTEPSTAASSLILNTMYGQRIVDSPSPCGANCSFTQTFVAPAYKCDDEDFDRPATENPFCGEDDGTPARERCTASLSFSQQSPFDRVWYAAQNSTGEGCQWRSSDVSCPANYEGWMEGKIWFEYQYFRKEYRLPEYDRGYNSTPVPDEAWEYHMFKCQSYNATYEIQRTYRDSEQTISGKLIYLHPIDFSKIGRGGFPQYHAAYAIHQTLYSTLTGSIGSYGRYSDVENGAQIANTALSEARPFPLFSSSARVVGTSKPVRHLRQAVQDLHFNVTVSLLSLAPQLLYTDNGTVAAEVSTTENVWRYSPLVLVATYAAAALLDALAVVVGVLAMVRNRGVYGLEFSRVVATTRASGRLDAMVAGWEDGLEPMPKEVGKGKVMYGVVTSSRAVGFGVEDEVMKLRGGSDERMAYSR